MTIMQAEDNFPLICRRFSRCDRRRHQHFHHAKTPARLGTDTKVCRRHGTRHQLFILHGNGQSKVTSWLLRTKSSDNVPSTGCFSSIRASIGAVEIRRVYQEGSKGTVQLPLVAFKVKVILLQHRNRYILKRFHNSFSDENKKQLT